MELDAIGTLLYYQKRLPNSLTSTKRGMTILSRAADRCEMMVSECLLYPEWTLKFSFISKRTAKLPIRSHIEGLAMLTNIVSLLDLDTIDAWCSSSLDAANRQVIDLKARDGDQYSPCNPSSNLSNRLLQGIQLSGFCHLRGAAVSATLANAIKNAETASKNDFFCTILSFTY